MNFAFSEEQEQLRDAVRRFMETKSPSTEVRRLMETTEGYDPAVWTQMAQELGLQGLHIPEEYGGQGFTFVELGIVLEEMGRVLLCAPYFSTVVLAANAILNAGTDAQKAELLPGHRVGRDDRRARVHRAERQVGRVGHHDGGRRAPATRTRSTATKMFVIDGHTANTIVVVARQAGTTGEDGIGFFIVDGDATGLTRTALATMDQTRKQARLEFAGVTADAARRRRARAGPRCRRRSTRPRSAWPTRWSAARRTCLDMSVEYAKVRVQFGRPIGSFQAIKHKCADMLLEVESGKSAAYYAAWAAAEDNEELPVVAEPRQGLLLRRLLPRRGREHPDPRRHRLHVGARRAPVLQAGEELRDPPRRRHVPPRAARRSASASDRRGRRRERSARSSHCG